MQLSNLMYYIRENLTGTLIQEDSMSNHCSIRVGGTVAGVFYPDTVEDIVRAIKKCNEFDVKYKIIGRGSNIIFPDYNVDYLFIKIAKTCDEYDIIDNELINVDAGYSLQKLSKKLSKEGFKGLEFAGGIPASLGGAIYMNAGAHTGEIKDVIKEVVCLDQDFKIVKFNNEDCKFEYRKSIFQKNNYIILSATLKMQKGDKAQIFKNMSGNLEYRKEMQPLKWPSFGSVFKNPPGNHAGKIIEELGLKGYKIGGAQVSLKHANFIINNGDASSEDVINLINLIKKEAKDKLNIEFETEVEIFKEEYEK